jgi:hypothetical protein
LQQKTVSGKAYRRIPAASALFPSRKECGYRIIEPSLKEMGQAGQRKLRRIPKTRAQANGGLDVLDRDIRLARPKS